MATYKQGALNQVLFVAVDSTDFATIESGVTSGFTVTLYGVKQGVSTAHSAITISRVPSVVNSGIFIQTLEAADTSGLDNAILNIKHASCADQNIPINFQIQDIDATVDNIYSLLSDLNSDFDSKVTGTVVTKSDLISGVWGIDASSISSAGSIGSLVVKTLDNATLSDIASKAGVAATVSNVVSALTADVESYLSNYISTVEAEVISNITSGIAGVASKVWAIDPSAISAASTVGSLMVKFQDSAVAVSITASDISDIASAVVAAGAVSASNISDIASAVWSFNPSSMSAASTIGSMVVKEIDGLVATLSQTDSAVDAAASQLLLVKSSLSDVESQIDLNASVISDVQSALDSQFLVYQSDISQLDSAVDAAASQVLLVKSNVSDVESQVDLNASMISDTQSQLDVTHSLLSDVESQIDLNASVISDVESALDSQFLVYQSDISDINSAVCGTITEMAKATAPPAAPTIKELLNHIYRMHRNKVLTTASDIILQNDAGNSNITSATLSDDGTTFTKSEFT